MTARMRFPEQALNELKREDPDTPVTLHFIRALAASGNIPVVTIGRRKLLNYDAMLEYLANPELSTPAVAANGNIRRVNVR